MKHGVRRFRNQAEYERWLEIRSAGFSTWYVEPKPKGFGPWGRYAANAEAALFPDFFLELRDEADRPIGYLKTAPAYWSGEPSSLHTYEYVDEALKIHDRRKAWAIAALWTVLAEWLRMPAAFEKIAKRLRSGRMENVNAVCLLAMAIDPEARGRKMPAVLMEGAVDAAARLGYDFVIGPFRPNAYGGFKSERGVAHSPELFAEYCATTRPDGRLLDPWLRTVVGLGARLLQPVERSLVIGGTRQKFEQLRATFRPDDWYSPAADVWECGETCTWYLDRARDSVVSVEPNHWGVLDVDATAQIAH